MAPLLSGTKQAMYAEKISKACANALSGPNVLGLEFLWASGLMGSRDECESLESRIKSAVLSELESSYPITRVEAQ